MVSLRRHTDPRFQCVVEIIFDRPEKRNALTPAMLESLLEHVRALDSDPSCRAILLAGEGSTFCAGFDLSLCKENSDALAAMLRGLAEAIRALRETNKPVVIAAQGAAIAGGCALLAAADLVVTHQSAKLGYPVVRLGISPAVNAPALCAAVGPRAARLRLLDPEVFTGLDALHIGLAHLCVDLPEDTIPRAQIVAAQLAAKPPAALAATKSWLREVEQTLRGDHAQQALDASLALVGSTEERERLTALWSA